MKLSIQIVFLFLFFHYCVKFASFGFSSRLLIVNPVSTMHRRPRGKCGSSSLIFFVLCLFFIPTVFRTLDTVCIHVINISWSHEPEEPCVFLSICYKSKCSSFYYISKLSNSLKCLHVALQLSRLAEINRSGLYFS